MNLYEQVAVFNFFLSLLQTSKTLVLDKYNSTNIG